ncbi:uncharacterized protein LOC128799139 isoform X3 [Vidua chalybeata]|uniref:uncharacterized protein LOC128799139 isoform X3 n=1 Tax=Vidua chalybeata TaxID=81927 RepID=UPI0023A87001|nr:uncharacterized protein LOC128799139 isoform X3 [Vidua chalybeata]
MNPGTQLGSSGASIPFCAAFWLVLSPEPPKLSSWWETRHHPQKPAQGPPPAPARRGQGELPHLDWRFCPKRGRAQSPAPGDSRGWHCLGFKVPSIPKLWFGVDGRVPFSEPSPHLCWASTAPNSKEFQIPFPPAPSPGSCSLGAVICPLEGTSLRVVALPWLLRGWWHCRGCSGVGGTAVALCVHPQGWWHCRGCSGVGGTAVALCVHPWVGGIAVALCVHPWGWWHCRGSVCPSLGLVALLWLCVSIPRVGGPAVAAPGSVALPWLPPACPQCHRSGAISCCTIRTGDNSASRPSASRVASPFHTFLWSLQTPRLSPPGCFDSCSQPLHGHPSPAFPTFGGLLSC